MVQYKNIIKAIDNYLVKCPTISEIRTLLMNMGQNEKYEKLKEKNLLNQGEVKYYEYLRNYIVELEDDIYATRKAMDEAEGRILKDYIGQNLMELQRQLSEKQGDLFNYEKRLFNGYKPREPSLVDYDISKYTVDEDGYIEEEQIESQEKLEFNERELESLQEYFGYGADMVNSKLYNGNEWNHITAEEREEMTQYVNIIDRDLSKVMKRVDGLPQDTVVYRGAKFDVGKIVGDTINFKGYTSTSFDKSVADEYNRGGKWSDSVVYTYEILLPKGTKGFCPNDLSHGVDFTSFREEHEFLMDKGFKGQIVDIDYENQVVTVMPV